MDKIIDSYISAANDIYDYLLEEYPDVVKSYCDILFGKPLKTRDIFLQSNYIGDYDFFNSFFITGEDYAAADLVKQSIFYVLYSRRSSDTPYSEQLKSLKKSLRTDRKNCYNYVREKRYAALKLADEIVKEKLKKTDEWLNKDKVAVIYHISSFPFFDYFNENIKIKYILNELSCFSIYFVCYEMGGSIENKRFMPGAVLDNKMVSIIANPRDLKSEKDDDVLRFFVESEDAAGNPIKVYFSNEYILRDGEEKELTEDVKASLGKKAATRTLLNSKDYEVLSGIYNMVNSFVYATKRISFRISELLVLIEWVSYDDDTKNSNRRRKILDAKKAIEKMASLTLRTEKGQSEGSEKKFIKPFFYDADITDLPDGDVLVSGILAETLLEDWKNNASRNVYLKASEYGVLRDSVDRLFLSELQRYRILSALNEPKWHQAIYYQDFLHRFDFPSKRKSVAIGHVRTFLTKAVENHLIIDKWVDKKDYFIADFIPIVEQENSGLLE